MKHVDHWNQAYCDDELAAPERTEFEAHIRGCAACRQELAAVQALWAQVDVGAPVPLAPRDPWQAVAARIDGRSRRVTWTWPQRGLAVAAMLAGVVVGFGLGGGVAVQSAYDDTATASTEYLEESLPSLDQLWLQLGDLDEDAGS